MKGAIALIMQKDTALCRQPALIYKQYMPCTSKRPIYRYLACECLREHLSETHLINDTWWFLPNTSHLSAK